jgi:hypothetical protein
VDGGFSRGSWFLVPVLADLASACSLPLCVTASFLHCTASVYISQMLADFIKIF